MLFVILSNDAMSKQIVEKAYENTVPVNVSSNEINILSVAGKKIKNIIPSFADAFDYDADAEYGVLYFKISPLYTNRPISAVVNDEDGVRYNLVFRPVPSPMIEEIMLQPPVLSKKEESRGTQSYVQGIKELIYVMAYDADSASKELPIDGISKQEINQKVPLWNEASMVILSKYENDNFYGEHFKITNITNNNLVLLEQEFYRRGVVAVSIENLNLLPNQTTNLYVVREK